MLKLLLFLALSSAAQGETDPNKFTGEWWEIVEFPENRTGNLEESHFRNCLKEKLELDTTKPNCTCSHDTVQATWMAVTKFPRGVNTKAGKPIIVPYIIVDDASKVDEALKMKLHCEDVDQKFFVIRLINDNYYVSYFSGPEQSGKATAAMFTKKVGKVLEVNAVVESQEDLKVRSNRLACSENFFEW